MNNEQFVEGINLALRDTLLNGMVENLIDPPGRRPRKNLVLMSEWYQSLSDKDKEGLSKVIQQAIDFSIFSLLCVLDNTSVIEGVGEKSTFELYAIKGDQKVLINDPKKEELHAIFTNLIYPEDNEQIDKH